MRESATDGVYPFLPKHLFGERKKKRSKLPFSAEKAKKARIRAAFLALASVILFYLYSILLERNEGGEKVSLIPSPLL